MNKIKKIYCRGFQFCFKVALPFLPYRGPKILKSVKDIPYVLKDYSINHVLIITDKGITDLGLSEELKEVLTKENIKYSYYDNTVANPTIANVEEAKNLYTEDACQAIIAMGGGSAMDCAKATGARIVKPKQPVSKMKGLLKIHKKLPLLFAVPTTAGTGSETTLAAVITDEKTHHKYPINDFCLIPRYAVLDYKVTISLPKSLTATTGMDALTHAVEAYIGGSTTRYTRKMAEEAVTLIGKYLKRAYDDGSDKKARSRMMKAAYCAGIAFTQSYVGYVHGIAHSLGGQYSIPHGLANAVTLPYVLETYGEACYEKLARLARVSKIIDEGMDDAETSMKFIQWIKDMNKSMNIPEKLTGIEDKDIPGMAKFADAESNPLYPVPKLMNAKELEKIYYQIKKE